MSEYRRKYNVKPKDYSKAKSETDFDKKWGHLSPKHYFKTQEAIKNGEDVCLLSECKASKKDKPTDIIKGAEIKEWGLDLDSLLVTEAHYDEKHSVEFYARNIL